MTASQPQPQGWELQHPSPNSMSSSRGSLEIGPAPLDNGRAGTTSGRPPRSSHASSTTTEHAAGSHDPGVPRWPFTESHSSIHTRTPYTDNDNDRNLGGPRGVNNNQRPRPKASNSRHVLRYWALEIATVCVAILLLVAIIALLSHYNGRLMPEWPYEINLNSAIAFLTTFLRAAIVAAVAEIIGQIKWTWFTERTRPLHHLQDFDSASRSVLGSLRLLAVMMWNWSFTSAGLLSVAAALVTIASLAVGPLTQQAIKTRPCPQLNVHARAGIPAANFVPGTSAYYRVGAGIYELEVDMKSAMIQGLTDPNGKDSGIDVICPSGNCTWPDYGTGVTHASMGLCSKCIDTTDFVSGPNDVGNLTLPDEDAYINFTPGSQYQWIGYSNLTAYGHLFDEEMTTASQVSLANFSILTTSTSPCTKDSDSGKLKCPHKITNMNSTYYEGLGDYIAASCVLYPCMKEYRARYENNVLDEKVVRTAIATPNTADVSGDYSYFYNYTSIKNTCVLDNGTWYGLNNVTEAAHVPGRTWAKINLSDELYGDKAISVPNACLYKMDGTFFYALQNFLTSTLLSGRCVYDISQSGHLDCGDAWWLTPLWSDMNSTFASIDLALGNFTRDVTNKFRMTGAGPDLKQGDLVTRAAEARGSVYDTSTCTYFDSKYMALSISLVAICIILLAWIAIKNYRDPEQPVWKGSVLPLLFFGLHSPGGGGGGGVGGRGESGDAGHSKHFSRPSTVSVGGGYTRDRLDRNATFLRDNGRDAPELDRIQEEAGRLWVRFHGGTDPGFLDLGAMGGRNHSLRPGGDAEASAENLVRSSRRSTWKPEFKMQPVRQSTRTDSL